MKRPGLVVTVASVVGLGTSAAAGLAIWVLLTQPLVVAGAVSGSDLAPFLQAAKGALIGALSAVARYL